MKDGAMAHTSDKLVMTNAHKFVHGCARHILSDYDGARNTKDLAVARLARLIPDSGQIAFSVLKSPCLCVID
jgi:hypothetical protein